MAKLSDSGFELYIKLVSRKQIFAQNVKQILLNANFKKEEENKVSKELNADDIFFLRLMIQSKL